MHPVIYEGDTRLVINERVDGKQSQTFGVTNTEEIAEFETQERVTFLRGDCKDVETLRS